MRACLQLDEWMAGHEAEEERKQRERQAAMAEDGWTVVVRSKVGVAMICGTCACLGACVVTSMPLSGE